jgi:NADH dehydrogenase [ubiquinone] 1 alpha subcomplex assembly factor 1
MEMLLFDFRTERAIDDWMPVNDVVMGGVSTSRLEATGNDTVTFTGLVSLENSGGFASVRSRPREHDLRGYSGLELRIRGDGRRYKINLKTDLRVDGILYRAVFESREDEWQTLRLPFEEFLPTFRGGIAQEASPLDLSCVASLGLMISDRQVGPFRLEIAGIGAYAD